MQLISKYNKGIRFLLCVIDSFSKYTWVLPLKDKIGIPIVNAFPWVLESSKWKSNKVWVDQGSEFYSNSFKGWFNDNDMKMYFTHNEGKFDVAERFIRTVKTKFTNIWQLCQKKVSFNVLHDIVARYNDAYHKTIKKKPFDIKFDSYADSNDKDPKFEKLIM